MQSSVILVIPAYGEPESIGGVPQCDRFTLDTARRDRRCAMTIAAGVVYVVAKAPRPRVTKGRLCPPLTRDQAAQLASAFLLDTLVNVNLAGLTAGIVCREASERKAWQGVYDTYGNMVGWRGRPVAFCSWLSGFRPCPLP